MLTEKRSTQPSHVSVPVRLRRIAIAGHDEFHQELVRADRASSCRHGFFSGASEDVGDGPSDDLIEHLADQDQRLVACEMHYLTMKTNHGIGACQRVVDGAPLLNDDPPP